LARRLSRLGASGGFDCLPGKGGSGAHMIARIVAFALQQRFITLADGS
jgi:hypothetical protein